MYHRMNIAGLDRDLPICKVTDDLYIAGFVIFGDQELTVACAKALLERAPEYDYIITAEAKGIPLAHEMARQTNAKKYFLARKAPKLYMKDVIEFRVRSITTAREQTLYLDGADAAMMKGKKILIVDDVIPSIRRNLRSRFSKTKNTVQTRGAIRSQVIVDLESKLKSEIIDSYGDVVVSVYEDDPTVCLVEFSFAVAHGLNQIYLTVHITV